MTFTIFVLYLYQMKRSAVVFGASGLTGSELLDQLQISDEFERITAVVRSPLSIQHSKADQVILSDYDNLSDHERKLHATDYYCCIGTTIKKAGSQQAFRKVDFEIPVRIALLASRLNIPNLVIISSIGANHKSQNFYLRTKGEMENEVIKIYKGNLKFARPSLLLGSRPDTRPGERAAVVFMKTFGWLFTGSLKKYKAIPSDVVARAMIHAAATSDGRLFIEGDDLFLTP